MTFLSPQQLQPIMPPSPISAPIIKTLSWNPLIIASVGSVCTMFLVFSYRILKLPWFQGMAFSRHRRQGQLLNENNPDNPSLQFQSRGLDSCILHALPITQFKKNKEELRLRNTECAVCLGEFEEREWLKHLPNCSHAFHVSCIDTWFQNHSDCPLCRSHVNDLEMPVPMSTLLETVMRED